MKQRIEIFDKKEGVLAFDMKELLSVVPPIATSLDWYLMELEAVSNARPGVETEMELEKRVNSSSHGLKLAWEELNEIASRLFQTINATIVGLAIGQEPPSFPLKDEYAAPFIIIEGIDTSLWAVSSSEDAVIESVARCFHDIKLCS